MTILKSIVVCLVLANTAYFLWTHGIGQSQAVPAAAPGTTLRLASEAPAPQPGMEGVAPDGVAPAGGAMDGVTPSDAKRCTTVGPFRDVSEAARAADSLRGEGRDPRQRVVDGEVWAGAWVYVPLSAGGPSAGDTLAKLKAAGIDQAVQMAGPKNASVISLGIYNDQKRAQARISQVHALGLDPGEVDRRRPGNLYWIDVDLKPGETGLSQADLQSEAGHINRLEFKTCPASTGAPAAGSPAAGSPAAPAPAATGMPASRP